MSKPQVVAATAVICSLILSSGRARSALSSDELPSPPPPPDLPREETVKFAAALEYVSIWGSPTFRDRTDLKIPTTKDGPWGRPVQEIFNAGAAASGAVYLQTGRGFYVGAAYRRTSWTSQDPTNVPGATSDYLLSMNARLGDPGLAVTMVYETGLSSTDGHFDGHDFQFSALAISFALGLEIMPRWAPFLMFEPYVRIGAMMVTNAKVDDAELSDRVASSGWPIASIGARICLRL